MKNKSIFIIAILVLLFAVLGCSYIDQLQGSSNSNKTTAEQAIDSTVGEEKIGIAECDEAFEELTKLSQNVEDDFLTKAGKQVVINKIRENLKQSIENNKTDKAKLAQNCREYKEQIEKYKSGDSNKNTEDANKSRKF